MHELMTKAVAIKYRVLYTMARIECFRFNVCVIHTSEIQQIISTHECSFVFITHFIGLFTECNTEHFITWAVSHSTDSIYV
jgi:hypothetical protein